MDDNYDDLDKDHYSDKDEIIVVRMPRRDYLIMRDMINRQKALNWVGRWFKHVIFVAAGGIITVMLLWDRIKQVLF